MGYLPASRRCVYFAFLMALCIIRTTVTTAGGGWTSIGPYGGSINLLVIDPETPSTLYAGTNQGGVFKSTDAAASWRPMNNGFPVNENVVIRELAIAPLTPLTLYMGTRRGLFKTTDGARTWVRADQGIAGDKSISALAVDPSDPSTLFTGIDFPLEVFKSTDGGDSWSKVFDASSLGSPDALAVSPSDGSIVYLGVGSNFIYKSTDAGETWDSASSGLESAFVFNQITVHPTDPDIVYASSDNGLFKTTDGAATWNLLNTPESVVEAVVLDPSNSSTVYATSDGVMKSTDGGNSWTEKDDVFSRAVVKAIAVDPSDPMNLYAGANVFEGIFKSTDGGAEWAVSSLGLSNYQILSLAFDPQKTSTIYAGAAPGGVHKSTDGGQTWEPKRDSNLNGFLAIQDIVVDPSDSMNVYVGIHLGVGVVWSNDGGETWKAPNTGLTNVYALGIHPTNPSTLYAASSLGRVFKSTNGAMDWTFGTGLPTTVQYTALAVDPSDGMTVYTGSTPGFGSPPAGIYKTTDGATTWSDMSNGLELQSVVALAIDPNNPSTLFAGGGGGIIQKSTDAAASWTTLAIDLSGFSTVSALAIDPSNSSVVYAGTNTNGVFKSVDGGTTWTKLNQGLPHVTIQDLAIDPSDPTRVLAAPHHHGVYLYQPATPQWLFAAGDPSGIGGLFDGVALSNYSGQHVSVALESITESTVGGAAMALPQGDNQQVILDLPADEQLARLRSQIFQGDPTLPAWIELTSDNSDIASFFQFGSNTLTQLDGGVAIEELSTRFFFQRVFAGPNGFRGQPAETRLTVLNPGAEEVTLELTFVAPKGPLGSGPVQATRQIPPRSFLDETFSELFGVSTSGGYVIGDVKQGGGVVAFELIQLTTQSTVLGLNASSRTSSTRSFSAQLATQPGIFTSLNLINTADDARGVTIVAVREDGTSVGTPLQVEMGEGEQFVADAAQILAGSQPATTGGRPQQEVFVGSLAVEADGDGVIGDVIFGDADNFAFAASLPLQTEALTEAIFSQFASAGGLFTGLAFYYPGSPGTSGQGTVPDTDLTVEVILANGESVGMSTRTLSPGERISELVSSLVPEAVGQSGGYIRVTSTRPLIAQVIFGALDGARVKLFSAVPPKVIK